MWILSRILLLVVLLSGAARADGLGGIGQNLSGQLGQSFDLGVSLTGASKAACPTICVVWSGPATGPNGVASNAFTVQLIGATFSGTNTVIIADGGHAATITPSVGAPGPTPLTITPTSGLSSFTFTYTPNVLGTITLSMTNGQTWVNPGNLLYTVLNNFTASGPSSGTVNVASTNFTVTLASGTFNGSQNVTISDGGNGGTLTPSVGASGVSTVTVTPLNGATGFTFTYTPVTTGALSLSFSNAQAWINAAALPYNVNNLLTASGPSTGIVGLPSTAFTVTLASGTFNGTQTVTIGDGSAGGTFTPSIGAPATNSVTVAPNPGQTSFTFTYNAASTGLKTLTLTNAQGWVMSPTTLPYTPSANTYTASGPGGGLVSVPSSAFTVVLANGTFSGAQSITISDGSQGGTFTPSVGSCASGTGTCTVTPTVGLNGFTFTYTPSVVTNINLAFNNAQSWTNPGPLLYAVSGAGPTCSTGSMDLSQFCPVVIAAGIGR